jgi:colanic acid/amylovoran biosynthesis glycosyltransferase
MRDRLIELGCPSEKATVQHLGVDVSEYTLESRRRAPEEPLRILSVGRFTEKKGLSYAIEALAKYLQRGGRGTLTLVGDAGEEAEQQRTKRRIFETINAHDLDDDVDWHGFLSHDELVECFYDHHLLLAPSVHAESGDNEGGAPVTLIEAAATGMPIVATEHCDIPEVVQQQETGLLAPERNADILADHLMKLFEHPKLLKRMGAAGRERVEEEYNAVVQGRRLERLYDQARKEESVPSQSE